MDILDRLVLSLDGKLPYMKESEKLKYDMYNEEYKKEYKEFFKYIESIVANDVKNGIMSKYESLNEIISCRNSLMCDLYYKEGVRDGSNFF